MYVFAPQRGMAQIRILRTIFPRHTWGYVTTGGSRVWYGFLPGMGTTSLTVRRTYSGTPATWLKSGDPFVRVELGRHTIDELWTSHNFRRNFAPNDDDPDEMWFYPQPEEDQVDALLRLAATLSDLVSQLEHPRPTLEALRQTPLEQITKVFALRGTHVQK